MACVVVPSYNCRVLSFFFKNAGIELKVSLSTFWCKRFSCQYMDGSIEERVHYFVCSFLWLSQVPRIQWSHRAILAYFTTVTSIGSRPSQLSLLSAGYLADHNLHLWLEFKLLTQLLKARLGLVFNIQWAFRLFGRKNAQLLLGST